MYFTGGKAIQNMAKFFKNNHTMLIKLFIFYHSLQELLTCMHALMLQFYVEITVTLYSCMLTFALSFLKTQTTDNNIKCKVKIQ